jgi:hypothetical protein
MTTSGAFESTLGTAINTLAFSLTLGTYAVAAKSINMAVIQGETATAFPILGQEPPLP